MFGWRYLSKTLRAPLQITLLAPVRWAKKGRKYHWWNGNDTFCKMYSNLKQVSTNDVGNQHIYHIIQSNEDNINEIEANGDMCKNCIKIEKEEFKRVIKNYNKGEINE